MEMFEGGDVDRDRVLDGTHGDAAQELAAEVLVDHVEISENWEKKQNIPVPRLDHDAYESASSAMTLLKLDRVDVMVASARRTIYERSQAGEDVRAQQEELMKLLEIRRAIENREFLSSHRAGA
jgi:Zn-dependent peptidase ImmA (M78 family)